MTPCRRTGVATYRIKRNGATVDTLPAPTPGLALRLHRRRDRLDDGIGLAECSAERRTVVSHE
jgi:hypothetical protein